MCDVRDANFLELILCLVKYLGKQCPIETAKLGEWRETEEGFCNFIDCAEKTSDQLYSTGKC